MVIFIKLLGWVVSLFFALLAFAAVIDGSLGWSWIGFAMMAGTVNPLTKSSPKRRIASFVIAFIACVILSIGSMVSLLVGVFTALLSCVVLADPNQRKIREVNTDGAESPVLAPEVAQFVSLCEAVLADELVHQNEAEYLMDWISKNPAVTDDANIADIRNLLQISLEDGYLDENEAEELRLVLSEFCDRVLNSSQPLPKPKPKKKTRKKAFAPAHGDFLIHYEDAQGNVSEREINVRAVTDKNGVTYLKAYCHARRAMRTFRLDRVIEVVDLGTGEVIDAHRFVGALH